MDDILQQLATLNEKLSNVDANLACFKKKLENLEAQKNEQEEDGNLNSRIIRLDKKLEFLDKKIDDIGRAKETCSSSYGNRDQLTISSTKDVSLNDEPCNDKLLCGYDKKQQEGENIVAFQFYFYYSSGFSKDFLNLYSYF